MIFDEERYDPHLHDWLKKFLLRHQAREDQLEEMLRDHERKKPRCHNPR
jgi:hypothetical protein